MTLLTTGASWSLATRNRTVAAVSASSPSSMTSASRSS